MRRISAQYVFTSAGNPLKRGVVTAGDDGTVISVEDTGGDLTESAGTEFYNGIIIPGLVNCHSHLELSHMHDAITAGGGLRSFISSVRDRREAQGEIVTAAAERADREMHDGGVVACGDISNDTVSFDIKKKSPVRYLTFIEAFGSDPLLAGARMSRALVVAADARKSGLPGDVTPHAVYSVSGDLFTLIREHITSESVISLHFLESDDERVMASDHVEKALELSCLVSRLILVHNTVIRPDEVEILAREGNIWFCLCPSSNMHISGMMPPVSLLREVTDRIVAGTDSLASNDRLDMLTELMMLHDAAPLIPLHEIIRWGTINGARALKMSDTLGSIEPGKKPGLLLVEPADLVNLRLLPGSRIRRLL
jgi:cytosine/adenosine deaminase-related metal-dependent hydrolase